MTKESETDCLTAYAEVIGRIEYLINHYDDPDRALARIREIVRELRPQQTPPEPAVDSWPIIISNQVRKNPADSQIYRVELNMYCSGKELLESWPKILSGTLSRVISDDARFALRLINAMTDELLQQAILADRKLGV